MRSSRPLHQASRRTLALQQPRPALHAPGTRGVIRSSAVGVAVSRAAAPALGGPGLGRVDGARRSLFGIGEVLGVLTNPSEVLRSLTESKKLLEEARQELKEAQERSQIPPSHTFSPLPGFFERPREIQAIERALGTVPTFTVLFGASSVGKTALLRQVLSSDKYHVLNFDLRIAGFADLPSLYFSLSTQLESYFAAIPDLLGKEWGWDEMLRESYAFKHDRLAVQKRVDNGGEVKSSDIAHLLELFQSALLSYWSFEPMTHAQRKAKEEAYKGEEGDASSSTEGKKGAAQGKTTTSAPSPSEPRTGLAAVARPQRVKAPSPDLHDARSLGNEGAEVTAGVAAREGAAEDGEAKEEPQPPPKRVPVFFLDEAHKLPALVQSSDSMTMKTFLDAALVLSKQDHLCHIMHATSDPFYLHWLRQMNVMQHCIILSVGDTAKDEARRFFEENLVPHIPDNLPKPDFDELYRVFGGKLAHLTDYCNEWTNSDGKLTPREATHYLQADSLIQLQLIHSMPPDDSDSPSTGFQIYSPLRNASPHAAPSPFGDSEAGADFKPSDLLRVMQRLQPGADDALPYFPLCREMGARAVDGMVRGRLLELRWSAAVTEEGDPNERPKKKKMVGPVVLPTTPVVRYAMGEVLKEYAAEGFAVDALGKAQS